MSLSEGSYYVIPVANFNSMLSNVSEPMRTSISSVFTRTTVTDSEGIHDVMVCLEDVFEDDWGTGVDPDGPGPYEDFNEWFADEKGWIDTLHPVSGGMGGDR